MKKIIAVGHRGAAGLEPENTIRGFKRAVEIGVDQIELDVRFSKDGKIVVMHDEKTDRTTNIKGLVRDLTYEELKKADAGKGEKIPLLSDVFEFMKTNKVTVQIELKVPAAKEVVQMISDYGFIERTCITSFMHDQVLEAKNIEPKMITGALITHRPADPAAETRSCKADRLHIVHDKIDGELVGKIHDANLGVFAWGKIDRAEKMDSLINLEVDGIGSDYPDLLVERLLKAGKRE